MQLGCLLDQVWLACTAGARRQAAARAMSWKGVMHMRAELIPRGSISNAAHLHGGRRQLAGRHVEEHGDNDHHHQGQLHGGQPQLQAGRQAARKDERCQEGPLWQDWRAIASLMLPGNTKTG
jgi:hypothetical protein